MVRSDCCVPNLPARFTIWAAQFLTANRALQQRWSPDRVLIRRQNPAPAQLRSNRKLNHATHMAAVTQIRFDTPDRSYFDNGRPSLVLISPDDLESLEESLDILRDDELMKSLRRSRREASQGKRLRLSDNP